MHINLTIIEKLILCYVVNILYVILSWKWCLIKNHIYIAVNDYDNLIANITISAHTCIKANTAITNHLCF